jgi:hypothetical protein
LKRDSDVYYFPLKKVDSLKNNFKLRTKTHSRRGMRSEREEILEDKILSCQSSTSEGP